MGLFNRPMSPREREKWERWRNRGKWTYVLLVGVLGWGVPVGLVWGAAMAWWEAGYSFGALTSAALIVWMTRGLLAFPLGGIAFGLVTWYAGERRYRPG